MNIDTLEDFIGHYVKLQTGYGSYDYVEGRLYQRNGGYWLEAKKGEIWAERAHVIQHLRERCVECRRKR